MTATAESHWAEIDKRLRRSNRLDQARLVHVEGTVREYVEALRRTEQYREMQAAIRAMEREKSAAIEADAALTADLRAELAQPKLKSQRRIEIRVLLERSASALEEKLASIDERIKAAEGELQIMAAEGPTRLQTVRSAYVKNAEHEPRRVYEKLRSVIDPLQDQARRIVEKRQSELDRSKQQAANQQNRIASWNDHSEIEGLLRIAQGVQDQIDKWRADLDREDNARRNARLEELERLAAEMMAADES